MIARIRLAAMIVLFAFTTSCTGPTQAYPGAARGSSETATLRPQGVTLRRVNGVAISMTSSGATVLPGANEVELTIDESNFNSGDKDTNIYKLRLDARAGATYAITGARGDGRLCVFPLYPDTGLPNFGSPAGCVYRD